MGGGGGVCMKLRDTSLVSLLNKYNCEVGANYSNCQADKVILGAIYLNMMVHV